MTLNPQDSRPVSQQIADLLRREIASGVLRPNQKIDSVRTLAAKYDVSPQAADKALGILKSEGLTYTNTGRGTFVRPEAAEVLQAAVVSPEFVAVNERLDELFTAVASISERLAALEDDRRRPSA
jgi:DNA-binding transcriptional regulator YhcF (GntR family)